MFVLLVLGIIIYSQIKALDPNRDVDLKIEEEYRLLAQTTLNTILKTSTSCSVERGQDSIQDLINYCLDMSFSSGSDPVLICDNGEEIGSCSYSKELINRTLLNLFGGNSTDFNLIGNIPYYFYIEIPQRVDNSYNDFYSTNFNRFTYRGQIVNETNLNSLKYKRAPSGLYAWATSQREVLVNLHLYYR